jgi:hypothetical protein
VPVKIADGTSSAEERGAMVTEGKRVGADDGLTLYFLTFN